MKKDINVIKGRLFKVLAEGIKGMKNIQENSEPEIHGTKVIFDKSTQPFEVTYSERGFDINGVRFSFEFLETAVTKKVHIVLDEGKGMTLDNIRMKKILKYDYLYQKDKNRIV